MSASKGVLFLMTAGGEFTPDLSALSLPHSKTPMWISSDVLDIITPQELYHQPLLEEIVVVLCGKEHLFLLRYKQERVS